MIGEITKRASLYGVVVSGFSLVALVKAQQTLKGLVAISSGSKQPEYEGNYEITPSNVVQVLATANKSMSEDVVVLAIQYLDEANPSGGRTITIGSF